MKKKTGNRFLGLTLSSLMVLGLTACGNTAGGETGTANQDKAEETTTQGTEASSEEKVVLDVINYHVGTDYAAD